jgi:hypothetical protein
MYGCNIGWNIALILDGILYKYWLEYCIDNGWIMVQGWVNVKDSKQAVNIYTFALKAPWATAAEEARRYVKP